VTNLTPRDGGQGHSSCFELDTAVGDQRRRFVRPSECGQVEELDEPLLTCWRIPGDLEGIPLPPHKRVAYADGADGTARARLSILLLEQRAK
jgi:hypothetical protein